MSQGILWAGPGRVFAAGDGTGVVLGTLLFSGETQTLTAFGTQGRGSIQSAQDQLPVDSGVTVGPENAPPLLFPLPAAAGPTLTCFPSFLPFFL